MVIPDNNGYNYLKINEIIRFEADGRYTHVHIDGTKKITATKTIGDYSYLINDKVFFRAHKSHIINLKFVEILVTTKGLYIVMKDGSNVPLARERKASFVKAMENIHFD